MCQFILYNIISVIFAYMLDLWLGDPKKHHPVCWIGSMISKLESIFYHSPNKFNGGVFLLISTAGISALIVYIMLTLAWSAGSVIYIIVNSLIIFYSISINSMTEHVSKIIKPLECNNIDDARYELSMIVSRDTNDLDGEMIVRSSIESISENFTDGVVSPLFYSVLFGGLGVAVFKAVSTLDSMVGYRNDKYELFGKASAKADDILNFIPARLSVLIIAVAGFFRGTDVGETVRAAVRYRLSHPSPNSAHSMSAFAGVLGVKLGGPVSYFGKMKEKLYIGDGSKELTPDMINEAVVLYKLSAHVCIILFALVPLLRILL